MNTIAFVLAILGAGAAGYETYRSKSLIALALTLFIVAVIVQLVTGSHDITV